MNKPVVIAVKFLDACEKDLTDYKVWCFKGKPYCFLTGSNRDLITHTCDLNIFDLNWHRMDEYLAPHNRNNVEVPKPVRLEKNAGIYKDIIKWIPEVRVDFYDAQGKIYLGEMTFTSACGRMDYFTPEFF